MGKEDGFKEHPEERDIVDIEVEEHCRDINGKLERQLIFNVLPKSAF